MRAWLCISLLLAAQLGAAQKNFVYNDKYTYGTEYTITLNCSTEYILEFLENGTDNSHHPARISVSSGANRTYPLFITAQQQKGVLSWQLPMVVETSRSYEEFTSMSRTLCPHNDAPCQSPDLNDPIIHLSTTSPVNITTTISLQRVEDFYVRLSNDTVEHQTFVSITPSQPQYYYYSFGKTANVTRCDGNAVSTERKLGPKWIEKIRIPKIKSPKSVILTIDSDDDICATVSIQNYSCPVFDNARDVLYSGYYLSMMRQGGITLNQAQFPHGFYIVLLVQATDDVCLGRAENVTVARSANWTGGERGLAAAAGGRVKNLRFKIVSTISYKEYAIAALAALGFFLLFYLGAACAACATCGRRWRHVLRAPRHEPLTEEEVTEEQSASTLGWNGADGAGASSGEVADVTLAGVTDGSASDTESECSGAHVGALRAQLFAQLTLAELARKKPLVLSGRSNKYLWGVLTISVFYALPVVQLVITYQGILKQTGDQDLCYYNFLCAHPLGLLSDFNHVYSNMGYVMLGALFLVAVRRRHSAYTLRPPPPNHGIPQQFGLFYAMGIGLMMEGLLSASYHFCPNTMNFQFDSSFMYVIAVLSMVRIYQMRHPDINARAHSTFGVLACIIFIGLSGILSSKYIDVNFYFWVGFTLLHLSVCLVLTFHIYYMGRFRMGRGVVKSAWRSLRRSPRAALRPHYRARFVLLVLANVANWALAAYGVYEHKKDFAVHLLAILMGNTILYTLFYIAMKLVCREPVRAHVWLLIGTSHAVWFASLYLFLHSRTKWSLTPAQSRSYNRPCELLQFYDVHDMWHFLSAVAMFLSFLLLLALDDGMEDTPRGQISVF